MNSLTMRFTADLTPTPHDLSLLMPAHFVAHCPHVFFPVCLCLHKNHSVNTHVL